MSKIEVTIAMPDINRYIQKVAGERRPLTPRETMVLTKQAQAMLRVIKLNWPVDTGSSRGAWSVYINPSPNSVAIIFENPMWYSSWVTEKTKPTVAEAGQTAALYRKLIPAVWKAAKPKTIRLMKEAITKTQKQLEAGQAANAPIGRPPRSTYIDLLRAN